MEDNFETLLDFSRPFDHDLFDNLVAKTKLNDSSAAVTLTKFKNDKNNFLTIEIILRECKLPESQLIALNILETLIDKKYYTFSQEIRTSFEQTILSFVQEKAQNKDILLNKFNQVFVKLILANHYRRDSTIVQDLIQYSQSDINQVINLFSILRLLSQEILVNPHPHSILCVFVMNLGKDHQSIFSFCNTVLEKGQAMEVQLIRNALIFLTAFFELVTGTDQGGLSKRVSSQGRGDNTDDRVHGKGDSSRESTSSNHGSNHGSNYIGSSNKGTSTNYGTNHGTNYGSSYTASTNYGTSTNHSTNYLNSYTMPGHQYDHTDSSGTSERGMFKIDRDLIQLLSGNILNLLQSEHTTHAIKALYVLVKYTTHLDMEEQNRTGAGCVSNIAEKFRDFLTLYYSKFNHSEDEFVKAYQFMNDEEKRFLLESAYLLSVLTENIPEDSPVRDSLSTFSLVLASLPDLNLFKMLLQALPMNIKAFQLCLSRFPRPCEVLITELDGEIVREKITGTEAIEFSADMTRWMYNYIIFDPNSTEIFFEALCRIDDQRTNQIENDFSSQRGKSIMNETACEQRRDIFTFDFRLLNSLCWSIGSVNPLLRDPDGLFITILRNLLGLCECKHKKVEKAIIASGIMFIVGKHHVFLKKNRKFLKTVIDKLFEFCKEDFSGIKDMATETFYMICEKLVYEDFYSSRDYLRGIRTFPNKYSDQNSDQRENYMLTLINDLNQEIEELLPYQQRIIFEGIILVIEQPDLFGLLRNRVPQDDPVFFIRILGLIVQKYIRVVKEDNFVKSANDQVLQILKGNNTRQVNEAVMEYFKIYFSSVGYNHESMNHLVHFYHEFSDRPEMVTILTEYFKRNIHPDNLNQEMSEFLVRVNVSDLLHWLIFLRTILNNFILQTLILNHSTMQRIFTALQSSDHQETEQSVLLLTRVYEIVEKHELVNFKNTYNMDVIENIIGLICDKDHEYIFPDLCLLLKQVIRNCDKSLVKGKLEELASSFENLGGYKQIFSEGLTQIQDDTQFIAHLNDFRLYVWTYYESDNTAEKELLSWRASLL